MDERADFYTGTGLGAYYIGSLTRYGDPVSVPTDILIQINWRMYEHLVEEHLKESRYGVLYEWLWPYNHSGATDFTYFFINGKVFCTMNGGPYFDPLMIKQGHDLKKATKHGTKPEFPIIGGKTSGRIVTEAV
jgi:hypothetical protein